MKRLYFNVLITSLAVASLFFIGCSQSIVTNPGIIDIATLEVQDLSNYTSNIRTRHLSLDRDSLIIGDIGDIAFGDSVCYILDMNASIIKFPYNTDAKATLINKKGNGPGEYIFPKAIEVNNDNVFLLDMATSSILKYDKDLNLINTVKLRYPADDFTVTDDAIIANNLISQSSPSPFIVYNMDGEIIYTLTQDIITKAPDTFKIGSKSFLKVGTMVYALDSNTSKVYTWDGKQFAPFCEYDFGDKAKPEEEFLSFENHSKYTLPKDYFHIGDKSILFYLKDGKSLLYCLYDHKTGNTQKGLPIISDTFPFFPRWQKDNELVGYLEAEDEEKNGSLIFYSIE